MKINLKLPEIVLGLLLLFAGTTTVKAQDDQVSLQQFYDELSPYGTWIQDPQYGYVWRPDVDQSEFRPYYSNGRWVMTEYGNTWVSNYEWGWAPFHYGRWIYDRYSRWMWIPDTTWGPAWVDWRTGGGYYGWAPMGPSISIHVNFGRRYVRPDYCWSFIPQHNIYYNSFPRYRSYNNITIINKTKIINNTYVRGHNTYYTGPRPEEIRRATNRDVKVYQVVRNNRQNAPRIDQNTVNIYSPRPSRAAVANPAPRNVGVNNNTRSAERGAVSSRNESTIQNNDRATQPARTGTIRGNEDRPARVQGTTPDTRQIPSRSERGTQPSVMPRTQQQPERQMSVPAERKQAPRQQERQRAQPQARPQVQQRAQREAPAKTQQKNRGNNSSRSENGGRPGRGG